QATEAGGGGGQRADQADDPGADRGDLRSGGEGQARRQRRRRGAHAAQATGGGGGGAGHLPQPGDTAGDVNVDVHPAPVDPVEHPVKQSEFGERTTDIDVDLGVNTTAVDLVQVPVQDGDLAGDPARVKPYFDRLELLLDPGLDAPAPLAADPAHGR